MVYIIRVSITESVLRTPVLLCESRTHMDTAMKASATTPLPREV